MSTSSFDSRGFSPHPSSSQEESGDTPTIEQLDRYLAGESSSAEIRSVRAWLDQFPEGERALGPLRQMRLTSPEEWDPHAAWLETERRLLQDMGDGATRVSVPSFPQSSVFGKIGGIEREGAASRSTGSRSVAVSRWGSRWSSHVIGAALAASLVWGFVHFMKRSPAPTPVASFAIYPSTYTTGNGERGTITLPDSTVVILNVGSRLEVDSDFGRGSRVVRVDGEAFFAVTHHQRVPFVVNAGNTSTRVLGTSFIVRKYPEDTTALIAVRDGKVMVESAVVAANEEVTAKPGVTSPVTAASAKRFTFTQGILSIGETSLAEAIPDLNRWYNVDIRLGDPALAGRRIEGQFAAGSLTDLAENLEWIFNLVAVRDGRTLTLYPK